MEAIHILSELVVSCVTLISENALIVIVVFLAATIASNHPKCRNIPVVRFLAIRDFGPTRAKFDSDKEYLAVVSKWWFIGSLTFPLAYGIQSLLSDPPLGIFLLVLIGYLFGISSFLKFVGCVIRFVQISNKGS